LVWAFRHHDFRFCAFLDQVLLVWVFLDQVLLVWAFRHHDFRFCAFLDQVLLVWVFLDHDFLVWAFVDQVLLVWAFLGCAFVQLDRVLGQICALPGTALLNYASLKNVFPVSPDYGLLHDLK
jgi:hypothetical protein